MRQTHFYSWYNSNNCHLLGPTFIGQSCVSSSFKCTFGSLRWHHPNNIFVANPQRSRYRLWPKSRQGSEDKIFLSLCQSQRVQQPAASCSLNLILYFPSLHMAANIIPKQPGLLRMVIFCTRRAVSLGSRPTTECGQQTGLMLNPAASRCEWGARRFRKRASLSAKHFNIFKKVTKQAASWWPRSLGCRPCNCNDSSLAPAGDPCCMSSPISLPSFLISSLLSSV